MSTLRQSVAISAAAMIIGGLGTLASAQVSVGVSCQPDARPMTAEEGIRVLEDQKISPEEREKLRLWNKRRVEAEKKIKTIRFKHFGTKEKTEIRQAGISQLRTITDPASFPSMLDLLRDERSDVIQALCDHLGDLATDESMTTLAYAAINEKQPTFRAAATERLVKHLKADKPIPAGIHTVVAASLESSVPQYRENAAVLASNLKLIEAIPSLIAGQISAAGGGGSAGGYIAWIAIGTQRAYVADLVPIVGDGAVGFDPVPAVLTEGVVLAVNDAVVTQYHIGVHNALVSLSSEAAGKSTAALGWNQNAWTNWYNNEFLPKQKAAKAKAEREARAKSRPSKKIEV